MKQLMIEKGEFSWEELDWSIGNMMPFGKIIDCNPERIRDLMKIGFPPRLPSTLPSVCYIYFNFNINFNLIFLKDTNLETI